MLHIVRASEAATINGEIDQGSFIVGQNAEVTVFTPNSDFPGGYEEYTKIEVSESDTDPTEFSIYWLVPNENYLVEIDFNLSVDIDDYLEEIDPVLVDIEPGVIYSLNNGDPI